MRRTERRLLWLVLGIGCLGVIVSLVGASVLLVRGLDLSPRLHVRLPRPVVRTAVIRSTVERAEERTRGRVAESTDSATQEALAPSGASTVTGGDLIALYERAAPGVVSIEVRVRVRSPFGGGDFSQAGSGSGFVYDEKHIVTNHHVVSSADTLEIVFHDGQRRAGEVLASDGFSDLAVVTVKDMPSTARPLAVLRRFDSLRVGQPVVAIGNPFGHAQTMTYGIISALGRVIPSGATHFSIPQAIQTDAAINPGNSGGPLLDLSGQVIGVNAQINTESAGGVPANSGVGFAIPAPIVNLVVPDLIRQGRHDWAYLGVTGMSDVTLAVAKANGLEDTRGAYITGVVAGGPSDGKLIPPSNANQFAQADSSPRRGIQVIPFGQAEVIPVGGDVVLAVDGRTVDSFDDLLTYVALETRPGQTIELTVLRGGKQVRESVTLGTRPTSSE